MGLDPPTLQHLSSLLHRLADANAPRIVLSLRPDDTIPDWITHLVYSGSQKEALPGTKAQVLRHLKDKYTTAGEKLSTHTDYDQHSLEIFEVGRHLEEKGTFKEILDHDQIGNTSDHGTKGKSRDGFPRVHTQEHDLGDPVIEMQGAVDATVTELS